MAYIGVQPTDTYLSIASQQITGNGGATYTLDYSVSDEESVAVFVNNVRQNVSTYSVNSTTLTLGGTISASDSCWVLFLGRTVGTKTPAVGSVTNDMLAGSIANSKLANSSITLNGSAVSLGGSATLASGITQADIWRVTSNFNGNATPIASNWERSDNTDAGLIGSGMSQSSGIFTFPETGYYLIKFQIAGFINGHSRHDQIYIKISNDSGSSYYTPAVAEGYIHNTENNNTHNSFSTEALIDVTNASNFRCKFEITRNNSSVTTYTDSNANRTFATFIRLGDT